MRLSTLGYRNTVVAVGICAMAVSALRGGWSISWSEFAFFLILSTVTEWMHIPMPQGSLSFGFAIALPLYILLGPVPAAWIHSLGHLLGNGIVRKRPVWIALFNFSQLGMSTLIAGLITRAVAGAVIPFPTTGSIVPLTVFSLAYLVVNNVFVNVYFYLAGTRFSGRSFWDQHLQWSVMNHLSSSALGVLLALSYLERAYMGALVVFIPLLTVAYMFGLHLKLEVASQEMRILYESSRDLSGALEMERVFTLVGRAVKKLVNHDLLVLFLYDEHGGVLRLVLAEGMDMPDEECSIAIGESIVGWVAQSQQEEIIDDASRDPRGWPCSGDVTPRGLLVVPLVAEDSLIGVLAVGKTAPASFRRKHPQPLVIMGSQMAAALQNAILYERTEQMAITDPLTGLYNYRYFYLRLGEEIRKARRAESTVGLLYLDIDDFKRYNDTYGHLVGDDVLKELAIIMREQMRTTDTPARYGGEEFAVILPGVQREQADMIAERLSEKVASHRYPDTDGNRVLTVSISVGRAVFPHDASSESELIKAADLDMYSRKPAARKETACQDGLDPR